MFFFMSVMSKEYNIILFVMSIGGMSNFSANIEMDHDTGILLKALHQ